MFEHKGYLGRTEIDEEAGIIHGEVEGLRTVITFQGESVLEARQAFRDSVDDYLAWCAERGKDPEKPYSGKILVRSSPSLHRDLALRAAREGKSLNQKAIEVIGQALGGPTGEPIGGPTGEPIGNPAGGVTGGAIGGKVGGKVGGKAGPKAAGKASTQSARRAVPGKAGRKVTRAANKKKAGPA